MFPDCNCHAESLLFACMATLLGISTSKINKGYQLLR